MNVLSFPEFPKPVVSVTLWQEPRRVTLAEVQARLAADGYLAVKWSAEPYQAYLAHAHIYPELLWLVEGDITVLLTAKRRLIELRRGDRVEMPGRHHARPAGGARGGRLFAGNALSSKTVVEPVHRRSLSSGAASGRLAPRMTQTYLPALGRPPNRAG